MAAAAEARAACDYPIMEVGWTTATALGAFKWHQWKLVNHKNSVGQEGTCRTWVPHSHATCVLESNTYDLDCRSIALSLAVWPGGHEGHTLYIITASLTIEYH